MSLTTYKPESLVQGKLDLKSTLDIPAFNYKALNEFADELVDIEDEKIKTIQDNYDTVLKTKDDLLGINPGTAYGEETLKKKKLQYGLSDSNFKLSMEDLRDPFKQRSIKTSLQSFLSDTQVKEVIKEADQVKKFEDHIEKLKRTNPKMADLAMRDLVALKTDPKGNINSLSTGSYDEIDFSTLIAEELKNLPSDMKTTKNDLGDGFLVFSDSSSFKMTEDQFSEMVAEKYADDPRVQNTLRSRVDTSKPESEQKINDKEAISKYLKEQAMQGYKMYNNQVTKNTLKEDDIFISRAKTEDDIRLKQTVGGGTASRGSGGGSGPAPEVFDSKTYGAVGSVIGNDLLARGYDVNAQSLLPLMGKDIQENPPTARIQEDGTITYSIKDETDMGKEKVIATFKKAPVSAGFIGTAQEEAYLNTNPQISRLPGSAKTVINAFINNPQLQDEFFRNDTIPEYNGIMREMDKEGLVDIASQKGIYGNKLYYLIHHHGPQGARDYIRYGKSNIPGNPNADKDLLNQYAKIDSKWGTNWQDPGVTDLIKELESDGNYTALNRGGSTAFGAYQYTWGNYGKKISKFMEGKIPTQNEIAESQIGSASTGKPFDSLFGSTAATTPTATTSEGFDDLITGSTAKPDAVAKPAAPKTTPTPVVKPTPNKDYDKSIKELELEKEKLSKSNVFGDNINYKVKDIDDKISKLTSEKEKQAQATKTQLEFEKKQGLMEASRANFLESKASKMITNLTPAKEYVLTKQEMDESTPEKVKIVKSNENPPKYRLKVGTKVVAIGDEKTVKEALKKYLK